MGVNVLLSLQLLRLIPGEGAKHTHRRVAVLCNRDPAAWRPLRRLPDRSGTRLNCRVGGEERKWERMAEQGGERVRWMALGALGEEAQWGNKGWAELAGLTVLARRFGGESSESKAL